MDKFLGLFNLKKSDFKNRLSDYFSLFYIKVYVIFLLASNLIIWLLTWLIASNIKQETIILHYNIIFGIDYIGSPVNIYWIPAIGSIWLLINLIISFVVMRRDKLLVHLLLSNALVGHVFLGLAIYSIYLINFVNIKF
ncbi:MAG: hypothetical protein ABIG10_01185 [bacterium]